MMTPTEACMVCFLEGKTTLLVSVFTSLKNVRIFSSMGHSSTNNGRPGGTRTPNHRIWSPALYQLELLACSKLLHLTMQGVLPTPLAVLLQLQPLWSVPLVLVGAVVSPFALSTSQKNRLPHGQSSITSVTTPAPTVRPPSLTANLSPGSNATG